MRDGLRERASLALQRGRAGSHQLPFRTAQTIMDARFMLPFVGRATKHDMVVSIRAGFVPGELPELLELAGPEWRVREETSWRGGLRVLASRA